MNTLFKKIPKIDVLLENKEVLQLLNTYPYDFVVDSLRKSCDYYRDLIVKNAISDFNIDDILIYAKNDVKESLPLLKPVINATGIVLHTNLGRAPLCERAIDALKNIGEGYMNLEFDLKTGKRGSRLQSLVPILKKLTNAEDAICVNNNAAAVLLCLSALGKGKNIIVSRGELIEIGGSFRVPDVILAGGCFLKEVGTTNKTHLYDYENAIDENTAAILHIHTSNYKIRGFTESVDLAELSKIAKKNNIALISDLGSGVLIDNELFRKAEEITVSKALEKGADIVTFSGDKLLGCSQAGLIVGKASYVETMRKNPLMRALRLDKLSIVALEATLMEYFDKKNVFSKMKTLKMLNFTIDELEHNINEFEIVLLENKVCDFYDIGTDKSYSQAGGGSLPDLDMETRVVSFKSNILSPDYISNALRALDVPIIAKIHNDLILMDVRTIFQKDYKYIATSLIKIAKGDLL